jgi:antitoxin component of MazEF toxin-antitoxin module
VHTTNLRKVGGSVMLAVPPALLDILHLRPGARVGIAAENGRLVVAPQKRPRCTMRVDSSLLLPNAARCLMKNVTRPQGRDEWQIEEATERGNETGTD